MRGYEIDLNWRANDEISMNGSWGHVYSVYTDFGSASPLAVGRRVNMSRRKTAASRSATVPARTAEGILRQPRFDPPRVHADRSPNAGDTYLPGPVNAARCNGPPINGGSTYRPSRCECRRRYTLRRNRVDQTFAINVNNVFDKDYLKVNRNSAIAGQCFFTYTIGYAGGNSR